MKSLANKNIRILTAEEVSETAVERFHKQYEGEDNKWRFADGKTLGSVKKELAASEHTPANITRILNDGWSHPQCYSCGKRVNKVVEIGEHWGDKIIALCPKCLQSAVKLIK